MKAATLGNFNYLMMAVFQSTPPVKAATHPAVPIWTSVHISIHAAREGGDVAKGKVIACPVEFQSTPPVKAATIAGRFRDVLGIFQSTPPVKAATFRTARGCRCQAISIHAAREGGDSGRLDFCRAVGDFNPRRP